MTEHDEVHCPTTVPLWPALSPQPVGPGHDRRAAPNHASPSPVRLVPLDRGLFTLVDAADLPILAGWTWRALPRRHGQGWYAVRWEHQAGRQRTVYLHRQLLSAPPGSQVDHINGATLDNRRANLRLCTASQNAVNTPTRSLRTGFRGVYQERQRYYAQNTVAGRVRSLGRFATAEEAARAGERAEGQPGRSFARLNFPEGSA